jgi:hypothetical protein
MLDIAIWLGWLLLLALLDAAALALGLIGVINLFRHWRGTLAEETGADAGGYLLWVVGGFGAGSPMARMIFKIISHGPNSN